MSEAVVLAPVVCCREVPACLPKLLNICCATLPMEFSIACAHTFVVINPQFDVLQLPHMQDKPCTFYSFAA